jgi:hypothetical protein
LDAKANKCVQQEKCKKLISVIDIYVLAPIKMDNKRRLILGFSIVLLLAYVYDCLIPKATIIGTYVSNVKEPMAEGPHYGDTLISLENNNFSSLVQDSRESIKCFEGNTNYSILSTVNFLFYCEIIPFLHYFFGFPGQVPFCPEYRIRSAQNGGGTT